MNYLFRLINVISKRNLGLLAGLAIGVAACFMLPFVFSFFYTEVLHLVEVTLDGKLEVIFSVFTFLFFMGIVIVMLTTLRAFIANFFKSKRYRTR